MGDGVRCLVVLGRGGEGGRGHEGVGGLRQSGQPVVGEELADLRDGDGGLLVGTGDEEHGGRREGIQQEKNGLLCFVENDLLVDSE